jgi:hypothetical protein
MRPFFCRGVGAALSVLTGRVILSGGMRFAFLNRIPESKDPYQATCRTDLCHFQFEAASAPVVIQITRKRSHRQILVKPPCNHNSF